MALTRARRTRLDKLATYLEKLPKRYKHFDMGIFVASRSDDALVKYALRNGGVASCGTAACAVGHGPAAGILMPRPITKGLTSGCWVDKNVSWSQYSILFVGPNAPGSGTPNHRLFEWLFAGEWEDVDNHHRGAAARIRYLLKHGEPPEGFNGAAPKWRKVYAPYRIDAKAQADA